MFKKIIIIASIALALSIIIMAGRYYYIKMSYQKIEKSMTAEKVLEIMGEPNTIYNYNMEEKIKRSGSIINFQYCLFIVLLLKRVLLSIK